MNLWLRKDFFNFLVIEFGWNLVIVEVAVKRDDCIIGATALRRRQAYDDDDYGDGITDDDDDCIIGAAKNAASSQSLERQNFAQKEVM